METKRLWGKLEGRVCYHGYQSFQVDKVTAETAHEIGVKLAQELWGDRFEVVVATHCNCDEFIYLGGNEQSTHEYVSKLLGKATIDTNTYFCSS